MLAGSCRKGPGLLTARNAHARFPRHGESRFPVFAYVYPVRTPMIATLRGSAGITGAGVRIVNCVKSFLTKAQLERHRNSRRPGPADLDIPWQADASSPWTPASKTTVRVPFLLRRAFRD